MFDWDDTLCPSWFLKQVSASKDEIEGPIDERSPHFEALAGLAKSIEHTLRAARTLGRVVIVTLAMRGWVHRSSRLYLPGLDLENLLYSLDIPIFYARETVSRRHVDTAELEGGVDLTTIAKMKVMSKVLRRLSRKSIAWTNIISIGDSNQERDAITEFLWSYDEDTQRNVLCKTVKFFEKPSVEVLEAELAILRRFLNPMVSCSEDFDLHIEDCNDVWSPDADSTA